MILRAFKKTKVDPTKAHHRISILDNIFIVYLDSEEGYITQITVSAINRTDEIHTIEVMEILKILGLKVGCLFEDFVK